MVEGYKKIQKCILKQQIQAAVNNLFYTHELDGRVTYIISECDTDIGWNTEDNDSQVQNLETHISQLLNLKPM